MGGNQASSKKQNLPQKFRRNTYTEFYAGSTYVQLMYTHTFNCSFFPLPRLFPAHGYLPKTQPHMHPWAWPTTQQFLILQKTNKKVWKREGKKKKKNEEERKTKRWKKGEAVRGKTRTAGLLCSGGKGHRLPAEGCWKTVGSFSPQSGDPQRRSMVDDIVLSQNTLPRAPPTTCQNKWKRTFLLVNIFPLQ